MIDFFFFLKGDRKIKKDESFKNFLNLKSGFILAYNSTIWHQKGKKKSERNYSGKTQTLTVQLKSNPPLLKKKKKKF